MSGTPVPTLSLCLSMSPLLPSISDGFSSVLTAEGISTTRTGSLSSSTSTDLKAKSPQPPPAEKILPRASSSRISARPSKNAVPAPSESPASPRAPSEAEAVKALFSTLHRMNEDVENEARRVRGVIKDTRDLVAITYREKIKTQAANSSIMHHREI